MSLYLGPMPRHHLPACKHNCGVLAGVPNFYQKARSLPSLVTTFWHEHDGGVGRGGVELCAVGVGPAQHVARKLNHSYLRAASRGAARKWAPSISSPRFSCWLAVVGSSGKAGQGPTVLWSAALPLPGGASLAHISATRANTGRQVLARRRAGPALPHSRSQTQQKNIPRPQPPTHPSTTHPSRHRTPTHPQAAHAHGHPRPPMRRSQDRWYLSLPLHPGSTCMPRQMPR